MKNTIVVISLLLSQLAFAQNNRQNIRGNVIDKLSHTPLIGANVHLANSPEHKGTITDVNGNFRLAGVTPGRYDISISYLGYKNILVPNVVVSSGKETIGIVPFLVEFT